uniref:GlpV protein n=1 Tax=Fopius arisanus TaxID=64838 RepID=A0A0C9RAY3_9HYME
MSKRTTSALNSCERIRPERSRNPGIQRLVWQDTSANGACGSRVHFHVYDGIQSEDFEVTNPRVALRRLLRLYEGRQYREAANFLGKLPRYTLASTLPNIPVDLVIETLPRSLALLEALYQRFGEMENINQNDLMRLLRVDQVLWKIIHLISQSPDNRGLRIWAKLLLTLSRVSPNARTLVANRKKSLDQAIEGLGKHGPIPCSVRSGEKRIGHSVETHLLPLTSKLREELELRIDAYKLALHKIENLGKDAIRRSKGDPHGLRSASHQRLLSLRYSEVQQRLIDNQSLLNTLEKGVGRNLEELSNELSRRVEQDKEALRQWTSLRKTSGEKFRCGDSKEQPALASRLLQFSKACGLALQLMNGMPGSTESTSSWCGEFFSTVIEDERYDVTATESSSAGYHTDDSCSPTPEPTVDYHRCLENASDYRENDATRVVKPGLLVSIGNSQSFFMMTVEDLTDTYVSLYTRAHLHTLDALDALEPLKDATDLKFKILFSVLVVRIMNTSFHTLLNELNFLNCYGLCWSETHRIRETRT